MQKAILDGSLGFFAGMVTAIVGFMLTELFSYFAHPFPADFKYDDHQAIAAHVLKYPHWVLGVAVGCWGLTLIAASWVGTRIGGRIAGAILAAILGLIFYQNILSLPYPFWFKAAELVSIPICLFIGHQMAMAMRNAATPAINAHQKT